MRKIPLSAKSGRGCRLSPIWQSEEFFDYNYFQIGQACSATVEPLQYGHRTGDAANCPYKVLERFPYYRGFLYRYYMDTDFVGTKGTVRNREVSVLEMCP